MTTDNPETELEKKKPAKPRGQRVFFALWPDEATRETIARFTEDALAECGGRAIAPENLHMTLRFIGQADAPALARLRKGAERVRADVQQFTLDKLGFWQEPAVFWLGCRKAPDALLRLVVNLNTELGSEGFLVETRPFRPHVTLARGATRAPDAELRQSVEWSSESFVLVASETLETGPRYTVLEEWPLKPLKR